MIKYGGNVLAPVDGEPAAAGEGRAEAEALASFAEDVVLMRSVGMLPVVVHGGGPQIGEMMARLGKVPEFRDGMRVTDAETLEIASMVLIGKVNREIVSAMNVHGSLGGGAVGRGRQDDHRHGPRRRRSASSATSRWSTRSILERLLAEGIIPVVATIAGDTKGQSYNINADAVAGAIAAALHAEKLVFLTDVTGLRSDPDDPGSRLRQVSVDEIDAMVASGAASSGMIPKVEACARAVRAGVRARPHPRRPGSPRPVARGLQRPGRGDDDLR